MVYYYREVGWRGEIEQVMEAFIMEWGMRCVVKRGNERCGIVSNEGVVYSVIWNYLFLFEAD